MVGAGSIGSCVALRLAEQGALVTIVDAQAPAQGLSAHSFGWVNALNNGCDPYFELSVESLRAHERLAAVTEGQRWFFRHGNLQWAHSAEGARQMTAVANSYKARGYPVEEVDVELALRELQPGLSLRGIAEPLIFYPADAHVVSDRFVAAVQERGRRLGVELVTGNSVIGFLGSDRVSGVVLTSGERIEADVVVSCAGRGTTDLLACVGAEVPLKEPTDANAMGLLLRTSPVPIRVDRVLHAPNLSIRPHSGDRLILHCHDVDDDINPGYPDLAEQGRNAVPQILARLANVLPGTADAGVAAEDVYIATRPMPADGMSVIGWVPGVDSLYVVVSHSGLTLAPVFGEIVAQEIIGEPSALAAAFRPERFGAAP